MLEIQVPVAADPTKEGDLASGRVLEDLRKRVGEIAEALTEIDSAIGERLTSVGQSGTSITVKLGLTLQAESGIVVSKVSAAATFEVSMTWDLEGSTVVGE